MTLDAPPPPPSSVAPRPDDPAGAAPSAPVPSFDTLLVPPGTSPRPGIAVRRRRTPADRAYAAVVGLGLVACGVSAYELATSGTWGSPAVRGSGPGPVVDGSPTTAPPATGLDPELQRRFEQAQALAAQDGVDLTLVSGWRSVQEQAQVVEDVVRTRGSLEEAKRWVLPPESSAHVAGTAIDVGATEGALWLGEHGEELGLCRTYANEMWHFEAVVEPGGTCPAMHEDSRVGWE